MPKLTVLVGPPGSGKSTFALDKCGIVYINQDLQGKEHLNLFNSAIEHNNSVIVDRMNFSKEQRDRYLVPAKEKGYETEIIVFHESSKTCLERMSKRIGHATIQDDKTARKALNFFMSHYERVQDSEADKVTRLWPEGDKLPAVICDLDGTLCDISHRLHHVRKEGKKDWTGFFKGLKDDAINPWCKDIITRFEDTHAVVFCSGRPDSYYKDTKEWLSQHELGHNALFMRPRNDFRQDFIAKEVILDYELLTRYTPYMFLDDRGQVCDLWRARGYVCLQVDKGDF